MGDDLSTKNLVGRTARDPWKALLGTRPDSYQIPEVGIELIRQVDRSLFERKITDAFTAGVILNKWSEKDPHFYSKSPAVMASIYSTCSVSAEAEKMIVTAGKRVNPKCQDCQAHYLKRLGTVHFHNWKYQDAWYAYNKSARLYLATDQPREAAVSVLNRGAAKYLLHAYDQALEDERYALELLGDEFCMYTIMCLINIAAIFVAQERIDQAIEKIEETQALLVGEDDIERPKLILRWIRALLLEAQKELKDAGEMLDRIEPRMRKLDMQPELKVLLADRARIARQPGTIRRIARKALALEDVPRIRNLIEKAMKTPTRENILKWRESLDTYVPPFPSTA